MSEIMEKARSFLNHGAEINRHKLIHDLLAELELLTASREAECMECEKLACIAIRQQAAREVLDEIDNNRFELPDFVVQHIKSRFGLEE